MRKEMINIALENLQKITGIEGFWQDTDELDGGLNLKTATRKFTLVVQFKNEIRLITASSNFIPGFAVMDCLK